MTRFIGAHLAAALVLRMTTPAIAQSVSINHYVHTAWRNSELKIIGRITALAQTRDGSLWLGTDSGLFRFDAVRARRWAPPVGNRLPSDSIQSLAVSRDGTLWIGTTKGLATWSANRLTIRDDAPRRVISSILEDSRGSIWLALSTPSGVCSLSAATSRCDELTPGLLRTNTTQVFEDSRGTIWIAGSRGLWRWAPGPRTNLIGGWVGSVAEDDGGNIIASTGRGFALLASDSVRPHPVVKGNASGTLFRSHDGALWITMNNPGLLHIHQGRAERFGVAEGLSADQGRRTALEDREGSVWIATDGGLDRFRLAVTDVVSAKRGIPSDAANSVVATADGSLWIGTSTGLQRWQNGNETVFRAPEGSTDASPGVPAKIDETLASAMPTGQQNFVFASGTDASGRLWVNWPQGAAYFDRDHFVTPPFDPSHLTLVAPGDRGATWLASGIIGMGVQVRIWLANGEIRRVDSALVEQRQGASALLFDPRTRNMWMGFHRGGLARFADGNLLTLYDSSEGLGRGRVRHLRLGSGGTIWAVTHSAVSRIDSVGHVRTLTPATGLPCDRIDWSLEADDGTLWLFGVCGLIRISSSEVSAWLRDREHVVQSRVFGEDDGVLARGYDAMLHSPTARTADGRFWFVAGDGIEILDPRRVPLNTRPPNAQIEGVTADGKVLDADSATRHRLELSPRVRNLEIQYSGSSLSTPAKNRFRFKLEGQDPEWREVVNERRVQYSNLRPGTYTFRLMASNNEGVWSTAVTSLTLHVPPAWNQAWWFFVLLGVGIAASGGGAAVAWQRRLSRLAAERAEARFDATLAERTRVARELHDTLLGDMAGVAMQLSAGAKRVEVSGTDSPATVELLSSLGKQVQHSLTEARHAVTAMRSESLAESAAIHAQLGAAAQRIFAESEIVARVTHTGPPRRYASRVEIDVVTIATEAMTNARRHAQCRTVTIECRYSDDALRIAIRDDGRGFDVAQSAPAGHWGLVGMRERASAVSATLTVSSAQASGTEVLIDLPAAVRIS